MAIQEFKLAYGSSSITIHIPEQNVAGYYSPLSVKTEPDTKQAITQAIRATKLSVSSLVNGKRICLLIADGTRSEPHQELIEVIVPFLKSAKEVTFFITTGSHDIKMDKTRQIARWIDENSKQVGLASYTIRLNDCFDREAFVNLGTTSRGTPILVNQAILNAEVYLVIADCKYHYFAGYSNYLKHFIPGACAFETIEKNHRLALDELSTFGRHPWHPDPNRRIQPLAEDMLEIVNRIISPEQPVFNLTIVTANNRIVWAKAGNPQEVSSAAFTFIDQTMSFAVEPVKYLVVTPGPKPEGDQLYDAQRGLELTKQAIIPGGEILWLVPCDLGIAPNQNAYHHFYELLAQSEEPDEVMENIASGYKLYSHKAYKFAQLLNKVNILVYTELAEETVTKIHMKKITDPQAVIDRWLADDPNAKIIVVDGANKTVLRAK
ncbi:MAG: lactate racemase domain-containing protein [bacterium]|nr:lactate racemase domain-containing protein [bacterium]